MKNKKQFLIINKAILVFSLLFVCNQLISSQQFKPHKTPTINAFWGLGVGVNDYGIGIGTEVKSHNNLWVYGNAGLSTWGYRLTGGISFYPNTNGYKSSFSLGYSYASGISNFEPTLEVNKYYYSSHPEYIEREVLLDLHPVSTLNLIYAYNLKVGRKSKFVFSGGYSLCLTEELYKNNSNYTLSEKSEDFIDLMAPGGIIIGVKFMI